MKTLELTRYALGICATAAMLAGCGGSQPPISAPGGVEPSRVVAPILSFAHRGTARSYQVLYRFEGHSDGASPLAGLIDVGGALYGTTTKGGASDQGTVYRVSTTGAEKVLHSFGRGSDGAGPEAGLIDVNGTLYGTTPVGGSFTRGTAYSISTTGAEKVLYSFKYGVDGFEPESGLINVNGTLYGTTSYGGTGCGEGGCGTVYRMSTTGSKTIIYHFKGGTAGAYLPEGTLLNVNGTLYGTTYLGGSTGCYYHNGCGTVFSISTSGKENWLYSFAGGSNGSYPVGRLIDVDGTLYGTTTIGGGSSNGGIVFIISTDGAEKVLHRFNANGSGAYDPETGLISVKGTLYGTTASGGSFKGGTIYTMGPTGKIAVLHNFGGGSDGLYPASPLLYMDGTLYGTTSGGGGKGTCCGTVFALRP